MKYRTPLLVTVAVVVILGAGIFLPAIFIKPKPPTNLPWQVQTTARGGIEVFGIAVGESALRDAERKFGGESEVTLFRSPKGSIAVEGYFDAINLSGLDAKIVLGLSLPEAELQPMYDRGAQVSKLGSGTQKVTLSTNDRVRVGDAVIETLTYMPNINLDDSFVLKRFGQPVEKWKEPGTEVVHWLYPAIGLDVAISKTEKEVLQYVPPAQFARLREPLTRGERVL